MGDLDSFQLWLKADFERKISNFSGLCWSLLLNEIWPVFQRVNQFKRQQRPEKFEIFLSKSAFNQSWKLSKSPILEGLPSGVYDIEYISLRSKHVSIYTVVCQVQWVQVHLDWCSWGMHAIDILNRRRRRRRWGDPLKWRQNRDSWCWLKSRLLTNFSGFCGSLLLNEPRPM